MTRRLHLGPFALVAATATAALVFACVNKPAGSDAGSEAPGASSVASAPPVVSVSASSSTRPPPPTFDCRAISVTLGKVKAVPLLGVGPADGGDAGPFGPVVEGGEISDEAWLDIEAQGKLTAKHPHSTREVVFSGPGRFRACTARGEEAWVAKGTFASVPSSGERPGGEEWVITPAGAIRYAASATELTVGANKTDVKVSNGTAYVWSGDPLGPIKPSIATPAATDAGMPDGWTRIDGTRTVTLSMKPGSAEATAQAALDRCGVEAKATKELANAIGSPDASLSQIAPRHVIARRIARAACAVAALRIHLVAPSPARDAMMVSLRSAEMEWRAVRPRGFRGGRPPLPGRPGPGGGIPGK